jgi:hypothetical protein
LLDCSDGAARIVQPVHASAGLCTILGGGIVRMRIPVHDPVGVHGGRWMV